MSFSKYKCNERFFEVPTVTSVYWLGFALGDGCVFTRRRLKHGVEWLFQVKLHRSAESHLRRLRRDLCYTGRIHHPTDTASALVIYSPAICQSLLAHGMRVLKTYNGVAVPRLPAGLVLPLAQGAFDANGCAGLCSGHPKVSLSGPSGLPEWFRAKVATHATAGRKGCLMTAKEPCHEVSWHGRRIVAPVLQWLLSDTGAPRLKAKVQQCQATLEVCYC